MWCEALERKYAILMAARAVDVSPFLMMFAWYCENSRAVLTSLHLWRELAVAEAT